MTRAYIIGLRGTSLDGGAPRGMSIANGITQGSGSTEAIAWRAAAVEVSGVQDFASTFILFLNTTCVVQSKLENLKNHVIFCVAHP